MRRMKQFGEALPMGGGIPPLGIPIPPCGGPGGPPCAGAPEPPGPGPGPALGRWLGPLANMVCGRCVTVLSRFCASMRSAGVPCRSPLM